MKYHLIHKDTINTVLNKARQYRTLREPDLAISICLDVFAIDDNHQAARVIYILALTDECFSHNAKITHQKITDAIAKLTSEFERTYYWGIFLERKARAMLKNSMSQSFAYEGLMEAISVFETAEKIAPDYCSDPILRRNSCLRTIEKECLQPRVEFDELY